MDAKNPSSFQARDRLPSGPPLSRRAPPIRQPRSETNSRNYLLGTRWPPHAVNWSVSRFRAALAVAPGLFVAHPSDDSTPGRQEQLLSLVVARCRLGSRNNARALSMMRWGLHLLGTRMTPSSEFHSPIHRPFRPPSGCQFGRRETNLMYGFCHEPSAFLSVNRPLSSAAHAWPLYSFCGGCPTRKRGRDANVPRSSQTSDANDLRNGIAHFTPRDNLLNLFSLSSSLSSMIMTARNPDRFQYSRLGPFCTLGAGRHLPGGQRANPPDRVSP